MDPRAVRRYAQALFRAAQSSRSVKEAEEDLEAIAGILTAKPEFQEFLESPNVARDRKLQMVDRLFSDRARPITMRLLRLMIQKRRENLLHAVRKEFIRLREEDEGILRIAITSAQPISDAQTRGIVALVERQTSKRVLHESHVNPVLMAGVRVQYGGYVLDGSVRGALNRLKEKLYIDVLKQA